jgi:hypothetical protein
LFHLFLLDRLRLGANRKRKKRGAAFKKEMGGCQYGIGLGGILTDNMEKPALFDSWYRVESPGVPWMAAYQTFGAQYKASSEPMPFKGLDGVL